jgi:hypothetical protein
MYLFKRLINGLVKFKTGFEICQIRAASDGGVFRCQQNSPTRLRVIPPVPGAPPKSSKAISAWPRPAFQNSEKSLSNQELPAPVQQGAGIYFVH